MGGYEMTADEYAGRFLFAEDAQLIAEQMEKAKIATNADFSSYLEHRIKYYDGVTGYIAVKYFIIKDKNGKTIKAYGVNQDITERKLLELDLTVAKEKAEESSRLKTAFINNISHEIRTPLNGILGFGGFMMDESISYDDKLDFYNILQQSTSRLLQTITDIMDISELNTGTIIPRIADMQVANVLINQIEKFIPRCSLKNIKLITQIPVKYENLIVQTDQELFVKIVSQLLSNAEKFTLEGSIVIGFEVFDKLIRFFVTDTGKGIAADKLEIIFEPFIQEDNSNTRGYEGNGLGLSIARKMLNLLGGKIWVESQKGLGSTFFFEIPYEIEEVSQDLIIEDENKTKITATKPFVLIAEDDELNFVFFKTLLNRIDCEYKHAQNGIEAVELCRRHPEIDLILMDIKMPVMNGIVATKLIREFRPELPIIAITAYAQTGDEQRFLQAGCNGYLAKPIKKDDLITLINKYINRSQ
jgi:signal transduction histidine kinase/CheY-like chemotaxis protein